MGNNKRLSVEFDQINDENIEQVRKPLLVTYAKQFFSLFLIQSKL
jgi:hypothetical protein